MDLTDREKEIILAMAEYDMNTAAVGRKFYLHRNSVIFWLEKIKRETGLDPRRFYDLVELVKLAQE